MTSKPLFPQQLICKKLLLYSFLISIVIKSKLYIVIFDWKCLYLLTFIQDKRWEEIIIFKIITLFFHYN